MDFANKNVLRTFVSPHSQNAWAYIDTLGWKKVQTLSTDGVSNVFMMLCAAQAHNRTITGTIDDTSSQIAIVYLN